MSTVPLVPASTTPTRALLYGRVSLDRRDGSSVDQQLADGRAAAAREGWRVVGEHRDDGVSASRYARGKTRPGWQAAMEDIADGGVDVLVVWEISRATRDRAPWAALLAVCTENDVKIAVGGKVHDPGDPDDGFMLDLGAALAVRESGTTRKRVLRDVKARAAAGLPHGRLAFGWRRVYDVRPNGARVLMRQEPDPEIAPYILEAARRFADGEALYRIARDFDQREVPRPVEVRRARLGQDPPAPGPWDPNQLRRIITSPTNAGIRAHNGDEVVSGAWEPIIPVELHRQVVARMSNPNRLTHQGSEPVHLLSGIATCGECGAAVRRIKNRGCVSYGCSERFCTSRKIEPVDELVAETLLARLERGDAADVFTPTDDGGEQARARLELVAARAEWSDLVGASEAGNVSILAFARLEPALLARIEAAQLRTAPPEPLPAAVTDLMANGQARERWDEASVSLRRQVVAALVDVRIMKAGVGRRTFDPSLIEITWKV